jgi:radical SAM/Cys-rich protein
MDRETFDAIMGFLDNSRVDTVDITGGAPEMHPDVISMIDRLASLTGRILVRSNLSALEEGRPDDFINVFKQHRVVVVASLPALNATQTESQRGKGIFQKSIRALKRLNAAGYGEPATGLELNIVSNPTGAFLPPSQTAAEDRFRVFLHKKWGIHFNHLFAFANVPLGRFRRWLKQSGNLGPYMERLVSGFNPCAVDGLMCRSLFSVRWDGFAYDCDFNLARGIPLAGRKTHISEMSGPPKPGTPVSVADHCYTCAAGSGFT